MFAKKTMLNLHPAPKTARWTSVVWSINPAKRVARTGGFRE
jgi:hypothetical protein